MKAGHSFYQRWVCCLLLSALLLVPGAGCKPEGGDASNSLTLALLAAVSQTATYTVVFTSTWSAATHSGGTLGIPANPHYSPLSGTVHSVGTSFWAPGSPATDGLERLAEVGEAETLVREFEAAGASANLQDNFGALDSPGSRSITFTTSEATPLVTLVTMLAPSPDWFAGVHDLDLRENGAFAAQKTVSLYAYDAGSDGGAAFVAANVDTNPKQPVSLITDTPLNNNPIGTFVFTRQ